MSNRIDLRFARLHTSNMVICTFSGGVPTIAGSMTILDGNFAEGQGISEENGGMTMVVVGSKYMTIQHYQKSASVRQRNKPFMRSSRLLTDTPACSNIFSSPLQIPAVSKVYRHIPSSLSQHGSCIVELPE